MGNPPRIGRMMENLYKTPEANLVEPVQQEEGAFFVTSLSKMALLYLATFGLYGVFWFYKQWDLQRAAMLPKRIVPAARGLFYVFFTHSLCARINQSLEQNGHPAWNHRGDAWQVVILTILSNGLSEVADRYTGLSLYSFASLLFLLSPLYPMLSIQRQVNLASGDPQGERNSGMSGLNMLFIVLGIVLWLLVLLGYGIEAFPELQA
ncbi:MFS transporter permease [Pseudomonas schmalbachii]|uniref:MFS transporter permease n=1 Tax=Pseudomonas schmalbachii TaxID=2816993 RepID=A0ABS3TPY4_9PSED|nr:MFS transporter permease [Pseudomonas schmalbachii]MBO3275725.1 MFS transporter permease [Pseudomonas schmalbachii]